MLLHILLLISPSNINISEANPEKCIVEPDEKNPDLYLVVLDSNLKTKPENRNLEPPAEEPLEVGRHKPFKIQLFSNLFENGHHKVQSLKFKDEHRDKKF